MTIRNIGNGMRYLCGVLGHTWYTISTRGRYITRECSRCGKREIQP